MLGLGKERRNEDGDVHHEGDDHQPGERGQAAEFLAAVASEGGDDRTEDSSDDDADHGIAAGVGHGGHRRWLRRGRPAWMRLIIRT